MDISKLISTTLLIPLIFLSALSFAEAEEELNDRADNLDNQTTPSLDRRIDYIDNWTRSNINALYKDIKYLSESLRDQARSNNEILNQIISRKDAEQNTEFTKQITNTQLILAEQFNNKLWVALGIILGVLTLLVGIIASFSPFIFKRVENYLTNRLTILSHEYVSIKVAEKNALNYHNDALGYYYQYKLEKEKDNPNPDVIEFFLNRAIDIESTALEESDLLPDKPEFGNLKAIINNNLCCYYLECDNDDYKNESLKCANISYNESKKENPNTPWYRWRETKVQTMLRWGDEDDFKNAENILANTLSSPNFEDIVWKQEKYEIYKKIMPNLKPPSEM